MSPEPRGSIRRSGFFFETNGQWVGVPLTRKGGRVSRCPNIAPFVLANVLVSPFDLLIAT
jgi:hypothetical protein